MKKRRHKNSGYSGGGASLDKKTLKSWTPQHYSAKLDLDYNLELLRSRAADLAMNSALGAAAINTLTSGVVGSGLKVYPAPNLQILGITASEVREWSRRVKFEFEMWSESLSSDYNRRNNFNEQQRLLFTSYLVDGDSFCLIRRRQPERLNPYSLTLQAIEAGRVTNPLQSALSTVEMARGRHRLINGLEVDESGRLVAVWIANKRPFEVPGCQETRWQRVRCTSNGNRNILHICYDTRPEMNRGAPLLAPVIETLKQVARYSDAELTSAIIKSFFSIFFVQPQSNLDFNQIVGLKEPVVDVKEYSLGSGTISALPRGVDVRTVGSTQNQASFEGFVNFFVRQIGAAINLPVEVMLKTYQNSYSASRAAMLQAEQEYRQRREAFINDLLQPVYEMFLLEAVSLGRINAPGYFSDSRARYAWSRAFWRNEANHTLDAVKEVQAAILKIENGLSTRTAEVANLSGADFNEIMEELKHENEVMKSENLSESGSRRPG